VRGRFGGVEHRVGCPDIADVLDAQAWVFEQVGGLGVDLERVLVVEQIEIEPVVRHSGDCNTNGYELLVARGFAWSLRRPGILRRVEHVYAVSGRR
jgi:hypothetical protein